MKRLVWWALIFITMILMISCTDSGSSNGTVTRTVYEPEYLTFDELRTAVRTSSPRTLGDTGKIYLKDDFVFVNELYEGVHVIDNSDPENPVITAFIEIPGNVDIAIRGTILYADSYVDLVALDISDPAVAVEVKRLEDIFPYPYELVYDDALYDDDVRYEDFDVSEGIVVGWEEAGTETYDPDDYLYDDADMVSGGDSGAAESSSDTGTGGSLARFTIVDDYLYVLSGGDLQLLDIGEPDDPVLWNRLSVGWDIETLFPYEDKLFIGAMTGMYIYDNSDPAYPVEICRFLHATSCDPVVVSGDYAYVTLRGGTMCGGMDNQLDIIDISDIEEPVLVKSWAMQGPYGLGIDGDILFICDGAAGLKVYDVSDAESIELLDHISDYETYDVILTDASAIVVGPGGLYQYDYSDTSDLELLSTLVIQTTDGE